MSRKDPLQDKANAALADAIAKIEALGYEHYDIVPEVRLTNNYRSIGSAQDLNCAFERVPGKRGEKRVRAGKTPLFRISIARSEFSSDADLLDVMLHEVIHTCTGCQNHGKRFKAVAAHANRVYKSNVTVTKQRDEGSPATGKGERRASAHNRSSAGKASKLDAAVVEEMIAAHVGESFKYKTKTYSFVGFDHKNRKNTCRLLDERGREYKCPPLLVAQQLGIVS